MPELKEIFEMTTKQVEPAAESWREQEKRQRTANRNKRIGAFAMVAAIGLAAVVLVLGTRLGKDARTPANQVDTRAEQVGTNFVLAYGAFDAEQGITYLADDADISAVVTSLGDEGLQGTSDELPLFASMLDAMGYEQSLVSCDETGTSGPDADVRCTFDFHLLGSREFGRSAFSGSYFDLTVQGGEIVVASLHWELATFSVEMWEPFAEWVSTHHPADAAVMYEDATYAAVHLTDRSVQLWDRRVDEYVRVGADLGVTGGSCRQRQAPFGSRSRSRRRAGNGSAISRSTSPSWGRRAPRRSSSGRPSPTGTPNRAPPCRGPARRAPSRPRSPRRPARS